MFARSLPLALLSLSCSDSAPAQPAPSPAPISTVQPVAVQPVAGPQDSTALFGLETREHQLYLLTTQEGQRYTV